MRADPDARLAKPLSRCRPRRLQTTQAHPGVSLNDVTDPARIDALSGNAAVNGLPVEIGPA